MNHRQEIEVNARLFKVEFDPAIKVLNGIINGEQKYNDDLITHTVTNGRDLLNLLAKHTKTGTLPKYITEQHLVDFANTLPLLINSPKLSENLFQTLKNLLKINAIRKIFSSNTKIQKIMLNLPADHSIVGQYMPVLFPSKLERKNIFLTDETIHIQDFKNIEFDEEKNIKSITIDFPKLEKPSDFTLDKLQSLILKYPGYFSSNQALTIYLASPESNDLKKLFKILAKSPIKKVTVTTNYILNETIIEEAINDSKITANLDLEPLIEPIKESIQSESKKPKHGHGKVRYDHQVFLSLCNKKENFITYLQKIPFLIIKNRREANKEILKSLNTTFQAKIILDKVAEKSCQGLNFKEFNKPEIYNALINLLKEGHSIEKLSEELFQFFQVEKNKSSQKTSVFNQEPFTSAYNKFLKQNQSLLDYQLTFLNKQSIELWEKAITASEAVLKLKPSEKMYTFSELSYLLPHALNYDIPNFDQLKNENADLNDITNIILTFLTTSSHPKGIIQAIISTNFLHIIDIDNLIAHCIQKIELLKENLANKSPSIFALHKAQEEYNNVNNEIKNMTLDKEKKAKELDQLKEKKYVLELAISSHAEIKPLDDINQLESDINTLSNNVTELKSQIADLNSRVQTVSQNITDMKQTMGEPLVAIENFPAFKTALELFKKEKIRLAKLSSHPYKIKTDKQDFQIQQQQQQQHNLGPSLNNTHAMLPPDLESEAKEELTIWLGNKATRIVKTMTKNAFNQLKNIDTHLNSEYQQLLAYGLPLDNLPKGFYINSVYDEKNPFIDYDAKNSFQQNANLLTQQLPTDKKSILSDQAKREFAIPNGPMRQFENKSISEADQDLAF
ncbi:MAG: hypothetical protein JO131_04535, partial [Gammaproteobacteria bacterium]|nr:hypothetical protein [Gammaproteobacteria bacterium]